MIKGFIICFAFLVVQLMVLSHIDNRQNQASRDVRPSSPVVYSSHREEKEEVDKKDMA
ncbi:hypothetical protein SAMN05192556_10190 [Halomonas caseinilytica]|uniref:Uncharacterized protein n=1 Tax=Halomonas caseinilytica TaxID=438744 RepID=A0A1M6MM37_9GAMM|nr:hypothetical protein SAMN04487952_103170 [Halomonas caseinilytica]SHJ84555.1 hypothetical protein SAMN05192556_10190 [Halomonas caseinilytica]